MPVIKMKSRDEWPEGLRELVKEEDGGFVLNVVPKDKLDEFRDNNDDLKKKNAGLETTVAAFASLGLSDPEKAKSELTDLRAIAQKVKDGELKAPDSIEQEIARRVTEVKSGFDNQIKALEAKNAELATDRNGWRTKFDRSVIDQHITNAVLAEDSGVNPAALPDVLTRAHQVYKVNKEGKLVAMNGEAVVYGSDGVTPLPPKEWLGKVLAEAPYLSKDNTGSGATGGLTQQTGKAFESKEFLALSPAERMKQFRQAQG